MKTSNLKIIIFIISAIGFLISGDAQAQLKIGYVDSEVILKQLPEAQSVQKELEELQKLYLDTVQAKESELKSKAETFKTRYEDAQKSVESGSVSSETDLKALNEEISGLQNELQMLSESMDNYKQNIQNSLIQRQAELFKPVKEKITKTIETVSKSLKINFVFDKADGTLLYGDKEFDITFKVLDKLK
ncbi:MAG: OmpH family outer membrane protein [Ignavibacteria bacterium]|nr:OmpH family outer membrane protein [Ignavibacteria bacterium]